MSVIDTKAGTKTWREPGEFSQDLQLEKNNRELTADQKKTLGTDNIGDLLNKVSDPNYVDPAKKFRGVGSNKMDKDAFFKLMIAQLKNQDPTKPMENHQMAAQLAQFSALEQMTNVNNTLTEMKAGKPTDQFQALSLIGKQVAGDNSKITRTPIDKEHDVKFNLPQDAKSTTVKILNSKNDVIKEYNFPLLKAGENKVLWNGQNDRGQDQKPGDYKVQIEAIAEDGKKLNIKTDFTGVVTGLSFSNEGPLVQVGKQNIRLKDIRQFSDPSLMSNDQNTKDVTNLDLKMSNGMKQTHIKEQARSEQELKALDKSSEDLFSELSASNELIQKVQKEEDKFAPQQSGIATGVR